MAAQPQFTEKHYTVKELAEIWSVDESTVRRIFQDEPGVFKIGVLRARSKKRNYFTLRIPESVVQRIYSERTRTRVNR